jgi:thiol-disulfide isomerase/thioredoxin
MKGERNVPLIIDLYATWCGPCILMDQEIEMVWDKIDLYSQNVFNSCSDLIVKICCLSHVLVSNFVCNLKSNCISEWSQLHDITFLLSYIQEEVITFFYVDLQWNPRTTIQFGLAGTNEWNLVSPFYCK